MNSPLDRFSLLYATRGSPSQDSARARRRCGAEFRRILDDYYGAGSTVDAVARLLDTELGAMLSRPTYPNTITNYLEKCVVADFLDSITFVYQAIERTRPSSAASDWLKFVERMFNEENLGYRVDAKGVVHFRVDSEHEANIVSAVAALEAPKFASARAAFDRARADLSKVSPDVLDATRSLFESAESLFKIITQSGASLDAGEVKKTLVPYIDRRMKDADAIAKGAAARLVEGFADWVNACHPYRHGHDAPEVVEPPVEMAVALMSIGAGYIRWLATVDQSTK